MRLLFALLILGPLWAAENLVCSLEVIDATTGTAYGYAVDLNNPAGPAYTVSICFDSSNCGTTTANLSTPNPNVSFANVQFAYVVPDGVVGSITPKEGARHSVTATAASHSTFGDVPCAGGGAQFPSSFTFLGGVVQPLFIPTVTSLTTRATVATLALIVNSNDPYSTGTSGVTQCTVSGTAIKDDGIAGYYIKKRALDCANVRVVSITVDSDISELNYTNQIAGTITALPSSIQFLALAWVQPNRVIPTGQSASVGRSMTWVAGKNGIGGAMDTFSISGTTVAGDCTSSTCNPYFNSASATPFTSHAFRPTSMLAYMVCSTCNINSPDWSTSFAAGAAAIDASVGADGSNPTGGAYIMSTTDYGRNIWARSYSRANVPATYGAPRYTVSVPASSALVNTSGILLEVAGSANNHSTQTGNTWTGGAAAWAVTSSAGILPPVNQVPATDWIFQGAHMSYGCVSEPFSVIWKFPDPALFMFRLSSGQTMVEAMAGAVRIPNQCNLFGDPLSAPFALPAAPASTVLTQGVTSSGVTVK